MTSPTSSHIQLVIPAEPEYVGVVRLACAGIAHRLELEQEFADDLKLVVTEACGHIMSQGVSSIQVIWELEDEALAITVQGGPGSPPPTPALGGNGSQWGEIGLFLIHSLMDEVTELTSPPGLRMVKYLQESDDDE